MEPAEHYYDDRAEAEWERLSGSRMEFAVTMRVLADYLPPAPAEVLDIGGGPGRYAIELSRQGYRVTLADVSAQCLELAREKAREADVPLSDYVHASADDMGQLADGSFDAVLMMGPLYHLLEEQQRRQAVAEAFRTLEPGGVVFAAFITRFGVVRYSAKQNPEWLLQYGEELLASGLPADSHEEGNFPGYFAHPDEICPLMEQGGFETLDLVGCEGAISRLEELTSELAGEAWETWVDINYRLGHEPTLHGAADHLLYVGRKPPD
ncbi:MAG: class I SAM-dependent methyltransferase [Planctomycetota bacterium]|jgi:2-polyprenyl-3-methyl-5-hydroxy-6-metoxy-1,4-benzoquinol methylase